MKTPEEIRAELDIAFQELIDFGFKPWMTLQELSIVLDRSIAAVSQSVNYIVKNDRMPDGVKWEYKTSPNGKSYNTKYVSLEIVAFLVLRQTFGTEVRGFHPLVETELLSRYADVKHHIPCDAGIIDFVCPSGEIDILIECKVEPFKVSHLRQINKYLKSWRKDIGDCLGVLVYPESLRDQTDTSAITRHGLDVMFVTIPEGHVKRVNARSVNMKSVFLEYLALVVIDDMANGGTFMKPKPNG